MTSIYTINAYTPVSSAFVETAPATLHGEFNALFNAAGVGDIMYIRPGSAGQQQLAIEDGSHWCLHTRSVLSYAVIGSEDSAQALIVSLSYNSGPGPPAAFHYQWRPFHIPRGLGFFTQENIPVPGLLASVRLVQCTPAAGAQTGGFITMRAD